MFANQCVWCEERNYSLSCNERVSLEKGLSSTVPRQSLTLTRSNSRLELGPCQRERQRMSCGIVYISRWQSSSGFGCVSCYTHMYMDGIKCFSLLEGIGSYYLAKGKHWPMMNSSVTDCCGSTFHCNGHFVSESVSCLVFCGWKVYIAYEVDDK